MVDLKFLDKLAKICRTHGITHLKHEGLELSLAGIPLEPERKKEAQFVEVKFPEQYRALTDDELLFGSAQ